MHTDSKNENRSAPGKVRHLLFFGYLLVCTCFLIWPGYPWAEARFQLSFLGLPFPFLWNISWVLATFAVLCVYYLTERRN